MAGDSSHSHRPHQKQNNKSFKSKHASRRSQKDEAKGRTHRPSNPVKSNPKQTNAMMSAAHHKVNRRNHAKQVQHNKRAELDEQSKLFTRKGQDKVQRVVAVVPLTNDVDALDLIEDLIGAVGLQLTGEGGYRSADLVKFHNQSLRFLILPSAAESSSIFPIIDGCSAADFVIFGMSSEVEVDYQAETVLRSLTGTGVGASGGVFGLVKTLPDSQSLASTTRQSLQSYLNHFFPSIDRIHCSTAPSEASTVVRSLCEKVPKGIRWREARPRLLAERVAWEKNADGGADEGTLCVEGVVRGARLDVNRLVHLQQFGDFQVDKILAVPSGSRKPARADADAMDASSESMLLAAANPEDADSLASTNVPDDEEFGLAEQTWPTEEEMASAPAHNTSSRAGEMLPPALPGTTPRLKRVPKGTSAYQAAWIIDSDGEDFDEDDDEDRMEGSDAEADAGERSEEEEEELLEPEASAYATDDMASVSTRPFADLSPEQEEAQLSAYLAERARERQSASREDMDFPDEVDTPMDVSARERFARYRGLKSFRTSKWDPYEELPADYSRCFMFEDFKGMGRRMERRAQNEGIEPGTRVQVFIKNVPRAAFTDHNPLHPFLVFGLLKHEHKYSVMNFTVQRNTEYSDTVRSKDPLVLQLGPRRFVINPIFSQHTTRNNGKGTNNVHKFERFLRHGIDAHIATAYLPITFGAAPAVLLRVPSAAPKASSDAIVDSSVYLVGTGALLSADPTRITAKRIILTGHPFKVHKKTATIRYMFFNQLDIEYFKPVQLRTKGGRTGYIKESLGTHGYFKAGFDGPIQQMDTICLNLYKRCFPKWATVWDGGLVGAPKMVEIEEAAEERENSRVRFADESVGGDVAMV